MSTGFGKFDMLLGNQEPAELLRQKMERAYLQKCRRALKMEDAVKYHGVLDLGSVVTK